MEKPAISPRILAPRALFDGERLRDGEALLLREGRIVALGPIAALPAAQVERMPGILAPGFVDLQVNGGGGVMLDGAATVETFARICASQEAQGVLHVLPTLITDRPEATRRVIATAVAARDTAGLLGLHLEGPHLDPRRAGAHDPALIRPMTEDDLGLYLRAAEALPALMITLAPCAATPAQIAALAQAGVTVSLGHADCTLAEARAALAAGASAVTHLFNAMSPLGHREPGLPGAVLAGDVAAGLIADGFHVAPEVLKITLAARPEGLFLVSDAMAVTGTDLDEFRLQGRRILRRGGRLTLEDGTLAGADLTLPQAVRRLAALGVPVARALSMATSAPARAIRRDIGRLAPGLPADLVLLSDDLYPRAIWRAGVRRDLPPRP